MHWLYNCIHLQPLTWLDLIFYKHPYLTVPAKIRSVFSVNVLMSYWVKFHLDMLPCLERKLGSDPWVGFKTCLPKSVRFVISCILWLLWIQLNVIERICVTKVVNLTVFGLKCISCSLSKIMALFLKMLTPIINSEISNSDFTVSEQADQTSPGVSRAWVGKRKQQSAALRYYDSP